MIAFIFIGTLVIAFSRAATPTASIEAENPISSISCATRTSSDPTASASGAVKFGCAGGVLSLDNSGKAIPRTNYPIPTGAIYMSPTGTDKSSNSVDGNDANDGSTIDKPVRSIKRAVDLVTTARTTIVMRGGEYRDWYPAAGASTLFYITGKNVTIQAYPQESPWFNGADVVADGWAQEANGLWSRSWSTPDFCGGKYYTPVAGYDGIVNKSPFSWELKTNTDCVYGDAVRGWKRLNPDVYQTDPTKITNKNVAGDPQMVFINDVEMEQKVSLGEVVVGSNSFYYDWSAKKIYIASSPTGKKVELTKRPQALFFNKESYELRGLGFKRYGSVSRTFPADTVVHVNEPKYTLIENVVFAENAGGGLTFSRPGANTAIKSSVFANNGNTPLSANGSSRTYTSTTDTVNRNDFVIEGNVFNSNVNKGFDVFCDASCGTANTKLAQMVGYTVKNNIFENAKASASGFWCDMDCSDGKIVNNIVRNNGGIGIFDEVSNNTIIASNLVVGNRAAQISVYSSNAKIYNNTVVMNDCGNCPVEGIKVFDDDRSLPVSGTKNGVSVTIPLGTSWPWSYRIDQSAASFGPNTTNTQLANNVVVGPIPSKVRMLNLSSNLISPNNTVDKYFSVFNYNAYYHASNQTVYRWGTTDGITSVATYLNIANKGGDWERNTIDVNDGSDPFMSKTGGDFRLKTDSQAYINKGTPIPSEVAKLIGVPDNAVLPRGAINWPR